jgi:hypothetical protein
MGEKAASAVARQAASRFLEANSIGKDIFEIKRSLDMKKPCEMRQNIAQG